MPKKEEINPIKSYLDKLYFKIKYAINADINGPKYEIIL